MSDKLHHTTVSALYKSAMAAGGTRRSLMRIEWPIAGNCEDPLTRIFFARPGETKDIAVTRNTPVPLQVDLDVRCRKCPKCLRFRQQQWAAKAIYEYRSSYRTWRCTFTFSPAKHDDIRDRIRLTYGKKGEDFDCFSESEQFRLRHGACSKLLTLWLKRVRKNSGAKLRYLIVLEAHQSGLPHYHAVLHEPEHEERVTKRCLEHAWPYGFTRFALLPDDESGLATYACKYLSKSLLARVRASQAYGGTVEQS